MPKRKDQEQDSIRDDGKVATILVEDAIYESHTSPGFHGDDSVRKILANLTGPDGENATQFVMATTLGDEQAAEALGVTPVYHPQITELDRINVTAKALRLEMIGQLQNYLALPEDAQGQFLARVMVSHGPGPSDISEVTE